MKYDFDSYTLYHVGDFIRCTIRARVIMYETVDLKILTSAVNLAIKRYPYFRKQVAVNSEGAYILKDNKKPIVVLPTQKPSLPIGCSKVNKHLCYVDVENCNIYFNMSHSITGGKGIQSWIMSCLYYYVTMKHDIKINVPSVKTIDTPILPTELSYPDYSMLPKGNLNYPISFSKAKSFKNDYIKYLLNPFFKKEDYFYFILKQDQVMDLCRRSGNTVSSLLSIFHFKAFGKLCSENNEIIRCIMAHNPCKTLQISDSHCDFLSHIYIDYTNDMLDKSIDELAAFTRNKMKEQIDINWSSVEINKKLKQIDSIDSIYGLRAKRKYAKKMESIFSGKRISGSYHLNYTGYEDWGDLQQYIKAFIYIVDGHMLSEVSAIGDSIYFSAMTLAKSYKFIKSIEHVLKEMRISYVLEGPFQKNLPKHDIPLK